LKSASQGGFDHLPAIDAALGLPQIEERVWTFNERFISKQGAGSKLRTDFVNEADDTTSL